MQKEVRLEKWWAPVFTLPVSFVMSVILIPYLLHQVHHIHILTLPLMGILGSATLFALAKAHRVPFRIATVFSLLGAALTWWTWPREQLGNWNVQLSDHIMTCALASYAVFGALLIVRNLRAKATATT